MNNYIITGIDKDIKAIYSTFTYKGHVLAHTSFVTNISDASLIKQTVEKEFQLFIKQMGAIDAKAGEILPPDVTALIGVNRVVERFS